MQRIGKMEVPMTVNKMLQINKIISKKQIKQKLNLYFDYYQFDLIC